MGWSPRGFVWGMLARALGRGAAGPVAGGVRACVCAGLGVVGVAPAGAWADIDPNSGIDFVTITHPNNAPWAGTSPPTPGDRAVGRGSVGYEYRIGRFEVTTKQWVEFFNAAYDRPDAGSAPLPFLLPPQTWGAVETAPINGGTRRWRVPAGREMNAVGDIGWRMAAMYCNWLHNNKSGQRAAFLSGAYNVSTFSGSAAFTDQATRSPGARYWIPSWDEWLKAAHYDPNKNGPGQEGWWLYSTTSDTAPVPGPPGQRVRLLPNFDVVADPNGVLAQANAGGWRDVFPGVSFADIPLGAYAVTSPWGLYDVAGATAEWTEEILTLPEGVRYRVFDGSWWLDGSVGSDAIPFRGGAEFPNVFTFDLGFRIASAVPGPWSSPLLVFAGACAASRRRSSPACQGSSCQCSSAR